MNNSTKKTPTQGQRLKAKIQRKKGRSVSSTRWLRRQINDPYVVQANKLGYRSRAAFKLREIDDRFQFLKPGIRVIDLGAAPGGWSQVAIERVNALGRINAPSGKVLSIDQNKIEILPGAEILEYDMTRPSIYSQVASYFEGSSDVVLSDMASPATGHAATDHIRIMQLLEIGFEFALNVLAPGGTFLGKVLKGGTENLLLEKMKYKFKTTKHIKPNASRKDSRESYVIAINFLGK